MKQKVRIIISLFIALVIGLSGHAFAGSQKATFKIGLVAPLTGELAFFGEGLKNAMDLAMERLSKDNKYNYELISEDDQFDPKLTATAANKLININKVDAIVSMSGTMGNIISPLAAKNGLIHFGITAASSVADGKNNFIHWTPASEETNLLVKELQKRGHKKAGILRMQHPAWEEVASNIHKSAENAGVSVVQDHIFQGGEKDFRTLIAEAKQTDTDVFVILAFTPQLEILTKQIKEAGLKAALTSIESFEITENVDLYEGMWFVSSTTPSADFVTSYEKKFGKRHIMMSPNAYDIVNLIVAAVEKAKASSKPSTDSISKEIRKINNFDGVLGKLRVMDNGIVFSKAEVKMFKNGKLTSVEK